MCSLPAWAKRACSSALLFISKPFQGNWCPISFRWAEVRFYVMLFFFSIFFSLFLTKCTLTFQCAATLGDERMRASLVGNNGETYHGKHRSRWRKALHVSASVNAKKKKKLEGSVFVFNLCVSIMACTTAISGNRFSSHKCITTINHFYKKSIYLKVFAS